MKIALITASSNPIPATLGGATETMMTHLLDVNELDKKIDFHIFSFYEQEANELSNKYRNSKFIFYKPLKYYDYYYTLFYRVLRKFTNGRIYIKSNFIKFCSDYIRKEDFDAVVLEGNCFQVLQLRKLIKEKIILHMHVDRLNKELDNAKKIINACSGVIAISEFCKNRMIEVDATSSSKMYVLKNTIDVEHFNSEFRQDFRNLFREKHCIENNQKIITFCGRLTAEKGVLEFVKALKYLNNANLFVLIIGSSNYKGARKTNFIKQLEKKANSLVNRVLFTGYISQSDLPNYLAASDICVVPSISNEAAGNVIIEGLACEKPVITSTQGGIPEYADNAACLLVDNNDMFVQNLAKAIDILSSNTQLYEEKKVHARQIAEIYNTQNYYNNFCSLMNKILDK